MRVRSPLSSLTTTITTSFFMYTTDFPETKSHTYSRVTTFIRLKSFLRPVDLKINFREIKLFGSWLTLNFGHIRFIWYRCPTFLISRTENTGDNKPLQYIGNIGPFLCTPKEKSLRLVGLFFIYPTVNLYRIFCRSKGSIARHHSGWSTVWFEDV